MIAQGRNELFKKIGSEIRSFKPVFGNENWKCKKLFFLILCDHLIHLQEHYPSGLFYMLCPFLFLYCFIFCMLEFSVSCLCEVKISVSGFMETPFPSLALGPGHSRSFLYFTFLISKVGIATLPAFLLVRIKCRFLGNHLEQCMTQ